MKWKIKAKSGIQLLSLGQILPSGAEVEYEGSPLPKEILNAQRQGLILVTEVKEAKTEKKAPTKTWVKKEKEEETAMAAPEPPSIDPPEEEKPKKEKKEKKKKKEDKVKIEEDE